MSARARPPRIAIIGCGAIARSFHAPALAQHPDAMRAACFADPNLDAAHALAREFGARNVTSDYASILGEVDGAIVTVPHHLHYTVSHDCLRAGVHVLCEKPLVETPSEAHDLVDRAKSAGVALMVNHPLRLYPALQRIQALLKDGALGELRTIRLLMGEKFDWPATTGFYFGVGRAPRGVIQDKGPHALDLLCWWLGGKPVVERCLDDSFGGGEAMAEIALRHRSCSVEASFSFLSRYANTFAIAGDAGRVDGSLAEPTRFVLQEGNRRRTVTARSPAGDNVRATIVDNFLEVVVGADSPLVTAQDVLPSIVLIDECYAQRTRFDMPWHDAWQRIAHG